MHHCQTLLQAARIVTQDAQRRVLSNAALAIDQGIIVDIGPSAELSSRWQADSCLHLEDRLVLPGLVNAHTHAAMTILRGLADDMPLMDWLQQRIFPVEQRLTPRLVRLGSLLGFAEMLRTGITACTDMYIFENAVLEAADQAGIRCLAGEGVFAFPSAACAQPSAALTVTRELAAQYQGHERLRVAVMPHSVYTTTPEILAACRDLAQELNLPLHMHLSETQEETRLCQEAHGRRPVDYCHNLGLLDLPCSLAHVVDVNSAEVATLRQHGVVVVHNPSSNMKLASGTAPVTEMLEQGLTVALGTDGAASNNRLSVFTEMRRAALLHKLRTANPVSMPAQAALDMATLAGAAALGDARLGSLEKGKAADCVALDISEPNMLPLHNEASQLVYAATGMETRLTMVGGEIVYQDGRFTRFDYPALCAEICDLRAFLWRAAGLA
ncbi:MAG: amidohydrolase [Desulfovibrio sp.]|nr:amidohydrolase [Desulfovibrio sp.]